MHGTFRRVHLAPSRRAPRGFSHGVRKLVFNGGLPMPRKDPSVGNAPISATRFPLLIMIIPPHIKTRLVSMQHLASAKQYQQLLEKNGAKCISSLKRDNASGVQYELPQKADVARIPSHPSPSLPSSSFHARDPSQSLVLEDLYLRSCRNIKPHFKRQNGLPGPATDLGALVCFPAGWQRAPRLHLHHSTTRINIASCV